VRAVQWICIYALRPGRTFSGAVLQSEEPAVVTGVLVTIAVVTFGIVQRVAEHPRRTFHRIAVLALVLSFVPNIAVALSGIRSDWRAMAALMVLHVVAYGVTIAMLTGLTKPSDHSS
jgi:hypothetical protein